MQTIAIALLFALAETVAGFQSSCLFAASPLRTSHPAKQIPLRWRASHSPLCGARSQMGFNTGDDGKDSSNDNRQGGNKGIPGGFPGGMPGMPPGMEKLFSDPEVAAVMEDPKFVQAMEEIRTGGPAAMAKYASDAEFVALMNKVQSKMGGMPGAPPNMPGFAGGMPPPPGMDKVLADPEIVKALQDPKVMKVMMEVMQGGPTAAKKYENDPEFAALLAKIQSKLGNPPPSSSSSTTTTTKTDDKPSSARLDWEASKFRTTNPNAGTFGFEAVLNDDAPSSQASPGSKSSELTDDQRAAFERLRQKQGSGPASDSTGSSPESKLGFDTGAGAGEEGSVEASLKAQIAEVNERTQKMLDEQQAAAFERLKRRQAEEAAARERYLEGERKYEEFLKAKRNVAARDREQFVRDAETKDPDIAQYKERVELMEQTARQWSEIKDQLRIFQVASGIQLLDPATGEPSPGGYALMALAVCLPLLLGVQGVLGVVSALNGLRGAPDEFDSYDPGAYLPPL